MFQLLYQDQRLQHNLQALVPWQQLPSLQAAAVGY